MIPININGETQDGFQALAQLFKDSNYAGLVAFVEDLYKWDVLFLPAFNPDLGIEMAQDFSFSGTPDLVHNGTDSAEWTGSNISGTKVTFDSTDIFLNGSMSVKANKMALNDVMEFDKGSSVDLSNFVAVTLNINIDTGWDVTDSYVLYGWDTVLGIQVGSAVPLEGFFNELEFDVWHRISIPLSSMSLELATIDAFRIECVSVGPPSPIFYIDDFQIEESGDTTIFKVEAPKGKMYEVQSISFSFVGALDTTLANATLPNLSYDKILGLAELPNGIVFRRIQAGKVLFSSAIKSVGDSIKSGSTLINEIGDPTNACITLETNFLQPVVMDSNQDDSIEIVLSDDLSGLISFTAIFKGRIRDRKP